MVIAMSEPSFGIFVTPGNRRSAYICQAMREGLQALKVKHSFQLSTKTIDHYPDVAIFYGLSGPLRSMFQQYCEDPRKTAVYIDLGYWGRRLGGKYAGYHKIAINCRHPLGYFQRVKHRTDRFSRFQIPLKPWRKNGEHILLAGMGPKAASVIGQTPGAWERNAVKAIRQYTDRPIIYRPKPNYYMARPVPGAVMRRDAEMPLDRAFANCWAVVSHHSNVCVDALIAGVPVFCADGLALAQGLPFDEISRIEDPIMPADRLQFLADVGYVQWNANEMRSGAAWRHLRREGLAP